MSFTFFVGDVLGKTQKGNDPEAKFLKRTSTHTCTSRLYGINSPCTVEYTFHLICHRYTTSPLLKVLWQEQGSVGDFSGTAFSSEDNSHGIVPTAPVVSLLGDSSAFLKEPSLWLRALFQHPWRCRKPRGGVRGTASQIPHAVTSRRWGWSLPAGDTQEIHLKFHHHPQKNDRGLNHCLILEHADDHVAQNLHPPQQIYTVYSNNSRDVSTWKIKLERIVA